MTASDRRFVVPTWALSARFPRGLSNAERRTRVDRILSRNGVRVVCIVTGNTVHAWVAGESLRGRRWLLHAYASPDVRSNGLTHQAIVELFGGYPDAAQHARIKDAAAKGARPKRIAA